MRADNELLKRADQTLVSTARICFQIVVTGIAIGAILEIFLAFGVGP